jgi:hypothetical protein
LGNFSYLPMVVGSLGFVLGHGSGFFFSFWFSGLRQLKSLLGHLAFGSLWGFFVLCAWRCLLVLFCPGAPTLFCLSKIK